MGEKIYSLVVLSYKSKFVIIRDYIVDMERELILLYNRLCIYFIDFLFIILGFFSIDFLFRLVYV